MLSVSHCGQGFFFVLKNIEHRVKVFHYLLASCVSWSWLEKRLLPIDSVIGLKA